MEKKWWKEGVVYQIYPRSFYDSNNDGIGDINGIIQKLDYLKDLGVDILWISPMLESPLDDNGYDISNYQEILKEYGTMQDYENLLTEAHNRGIKILMDLVVNHSSDEHKWFIESKKAKDNPYRDYYIWKEGKDGKEPNNWGSIFGGSAWQFDETTEMYYLHLFSKKQPDLNWESKKLRKEIYDMMTFWCEKGIDGFRMDVISMISKDQHYLDGKVWPGALYGDNSPYIMNGPRVHEFLQEMNTQVLSKYDLLTVGETAGVTIEEAKKYANSNNSELSMVFQFEHIGVGDGDLGKFTTKRFDFSTFKKIIIKWQTELNGKAWNSNFLGNHDQPRSVTRFGNDSNEYRELSAKMLATFNQLLQGTPYIYQGEELGMTNAYFDKIEDYNDIESLRYFDEYTKAGRISKEHMMECLKLRSRDNSRTPIHWNNTENAGFSNAKPWLKVIDNYKEINAQEQIEREDSVFNYYKKLLAFRKNNEVVFYGKFVPFMEDSKEIFAFTRELEDRKLFVMCNFTDKEVSIEIPKEFENAKCVLENYTIHKKISYTLKAYETFVLEI